MNDASNSAMLNQAQGLNKNVAALVAALRSAFTGNVSQGRFTCTASSSITVLDANVKSNSIVQLQDANSAAATLQGSSGRLYVDPATIVPGTSFTVKTASGSAAGTEIFTYIIATVA